MLTFPEESGASMLPARIRHFGKLLPYSVFSEYLQTHIRETRTAVGSRNIGALRNYVECLMYLFMEIVCVRLVFVKIYRRYRNIFFKQETAEVDFLA